ncbi:MAG: tRNA pseudouridine(55) synthase TruB [Proteobacteria bacterium]|nr:tRNA pseudouridine(55) synthase TruB [Pseudomonadota bacterium]
MGRGARKPEGFRDVDGILLLHKPVGISSNRALQKVRHLFKANKAGHTGSLDPLASGLLPICFGEATKFSGYLLDAAKYYRAVCQLGKTTRTGDAEGEVIAELPVQVNRAQIDSVLKQFTGTVKQVPPMYSAIKHKGQRLYHLARIGKEVERPARSIEIYSLNLIDFSDDQLELDIHCSKGTYIRTLVEDIAKAAGTLAHAASLHREQVGDFSAADMLDLPTAVATVDADGPRALRERLMPPDAALASWPDVAIDSLAAGKFSGGQSVPVANAGLGLVRVYDDQKIFLGVGELSTTGKLAPKRIFHAAP